MPSEGCGTAKTPPDAVTRALEANRAAYEAIRAGLRVGMTEKDAYALVGAAVDRVCGDEPHAFIGDFVGGARKVPSWSPVLSAPDAVKKVIDGKCPGHSQGMCVTSNAFYLSFHNQIVKTDWKGRFLKRVEAVPHGGDICYWKGRVYVGAWEPPAKKGAKGCTAIKVYDAETLKGELAAVN